MTATETRAAAYEYARKFGHTYHRRGAMSRSEIIDAVRDAYIAGVGASLNLAEQDSAGAILALQELRAARGALSHWELAERVTAILDRSTLKPLDVVEYLQLQGLRGVALHRAVGKFAPRLRDLYIGLHGTPPLHRLELLPGVKERRPVYAYLENDRELFDRAWNEINDEHEQEQRRVSEIVRSGETTVSGMTL